MRLELETNQAAYSIQDDLGNDQPQDQMVPFVLI